MKWKKVLNSTLEGVTGYSVKRVKLPEPVPVTPPPALLPPRMPGDVVRGPVDPAADRLLREPVFLLASVRSGSTLLRVMLNSHSQLHAPLETHFRRATVNLTTDPIQQAMAALGHSHSDVEHLLWDRLLHRELLRSGKRVLVEKTPSNVFAWKRIATCWPDARFIFLIRHPLSIARSWHEADPAARPMSEAVPHAMRYATYLEEARQKVGGLTVTYERMTTDPATELRAICDRIGVPYEPGMIRYGDHDHGEFVKGIGDWRDKIMTGTVQPGRPLPTAEEVPEEMREMCVRWGYL